MTDVDMRPFARAAGVDVNFSSLVFKEGDPADQALPGQSFTVNGAGPSRHSATLDLISRQRSTAACPPSSPSMVSLRTM
jgi:hypothetical protein